MSQNLKARLRAMLVEYFQLVLAKLWDTLFLKKNVHHQFRIITFKIKFIGQDDSQNGLIIATCCQSSHVSYIRKKCKAD